MALIKCIECGKEISESAKQCPHCGCPVKKSVQAERERQAQIEWEQATPGVKRASIIVVFVLILAALFLFKSCSSAGPSNPTLTCHICGKTYSHTDTTGNYNSILRTNMCKKCYSNFEYAKEAYEGITGEEYKGRR